MAAAITEVEILQTLHGGKKNQWYIFFITEIGSHVQIRKKTKSHSAFHSRDFQDANLRKTYQCIL